MCTHGYNSPESIENEPTKFVVSPWIAIFVVSLAKVSRPFTSWQMSHALYSFPPQACDNDMDCKQVQGEKYDHTLRLDGPGEGKLKNNILLALIYLSSQFMLWVKGV